MIKDEDAYRWLADKTGITYAQAQSYFSRLERTARQAEWKKQDEISELRKRLQEVEKQAALIEKIDSMLQDTDSVIARQGIQTLLRIAWRTNGYRGNFGHYARLFDWLAQPSWMHEAIIRAMINILEDDLIVGYSDPIAGVADKVGFPVEIVTPAMFLARELEAIKCEQHPEPEADD